MNKHFTFIVLIVILIVFLLKKRKIIKFHTVIWKIEVNIVSWNAPIFNAF